MSTITDQPGRRAGTSIDRAVVVALVSAVAAAAWLLIAFGYGHQNVPDAASTSVPDVTAATEATGHGQHSAAAAGLAPGFATAMLRLSGWGLMVLAMMLPPALPLVHTVRSITRRRAGSWALTALGTAAFILPWIAVGVLLVSLDVVLTLVTAASEWTQRNGQLVASLAAIAAGLYQFTPAKRACLTACRSPRQLALTHWHGLVPASDVVQIGIRYGVVCVGCCWALMLLTLAVGWPAMPVMIVMTAVMAAERLVPRVRPLIPAIALVAIALGIALLAGIVPAGHIIGGGHL